MLSGRPHLSGMPDQRVRYSATCRLNTRCPRRCRRGHHRGCSRCSSSHRCCRIKGPFDVLSKYQSHSPGSLFPFFLFVLGFFFFPNSVYHFFSFSHVSLHILRPCFGFLAPAFLFIISLFPPFYVYDEQESFTKSQVPPITWIPMHGSQVS